MPVKRKCPHCFSDDIVRSHRRSWECVLFFLKPLRCVDCQHRYYVSNLPKMPARTL